MFGKIFAGLTLVSTTVLTFFLALKGLGWPVDRIWTDLGLAGLHVFFPLCGLVLVVESVRKKRWVQLALTALPLTGFTASMVLYLNQTTLPAPALVAFDFYLILGLGAYLVFAFQKQADRPRNIHF